MLSHSKQTERPVQRPWGGNAIAEFEESIKVQMEEIAKIEKTLIDTVLLFSDKFETKKRDKNILDFHDMEHMALDILISRKEDPKTGERTWEASLRRLDYLEMSYFPFTF